MGLALFLRVGEAHAGLGLSIAADDVAKNINGSVDKLPGLISAFSYLAALVLGVTGILRVKDHVENPSQGKLKEGLVRLLAGGGLLALPIVYEAMAHAINGGVTSDFAPQNTAGGAIDAMIGKISSIVPSFDFNSILKKIQQGIEELPGLISSTAYLMGLLFGVVGILKLKEHVESPDRTPLKEAITRFLIGGALFTIPTVYEAMYNAIGGPGILGSITSIFGDVGLMYSTYGGGGCDPMGGVVGTVIGLLTGSGGATMGSSVCHAIASAGLFPAFLTMIGYLIGLVLGVWGVLKLQAHVLNPGQTPLHEAISRLLAGGLFFALPAIIEIIRNTVTPLTLDAASLSPTSGFSQAGGCGASGGDSSGGCGAGGLDTILANFMGDVFSPLHIALNFISFCAGTILIMVGISRLMKSAQDGPRGPGGLGTFMTFICAGALISYNSILSGATGTLFSNGLNPLPVSKTQVKLTYTGGMSGDEINHANMVITSVLEFMILVGLISFVRGIFIIREASEGGQQASIMAGVTHLVGGALAVNLGSLINVVEATLGITSYGIQFS